MKFDLMLLVILIGLGTLIWKVMEPAHSIIDKITDRNKTVVKESYFKQQGSVPLQEEHKEQEQEHKKEHKEKVHKAPTFPTDKELSKHKHKTVPNAEERVQKVLKKRVPTARAIPAFPGAEGGGAASKGGRGGEVYVVRNLRDSGEGSLRYGLENVHGARTIVFAVGGYIHLSHAIVVRDDAFITIAGQTAPGDGITVTTVNSEDEVFLFERCHDVIVRYLRIRKGGTKAKGQHGSCLVFAHGGKDIMVDHCSISWSGDDNMEIAGNIKNITIQYTISSEGQSYDHAATGIFIGGLRNIESMTDISIHHDLFANSQNRDPLMKVASGDVVSNLIYNWSWWATGISGGMVVDIINNKYKAGPNLKAKGRNRGEVLIKDFDPTHKYPGATGINKKASIFFEGNIGPHNSVSSRDSWDLMVEKVNKNWSYFMVDGKRRKTVAPRSYQRKTRRALRYPITLTPANKLENLLLRRGGVGASRRLSENGTWVENYDLVDRRVIKDYKNREGTMVTTVDSAGGWPVYLGNNRYKYVSEKTFIKKLDEYKLNGGIPYSDRDSDGMPDVWEDKYGLNKNDKSDAIGDMDGDGYDNLEEFLNGTRP